MSGAHVMPRVPLRVRVGDLRSDPLVLNSAFLMLTTVLGAGSGFLFWLIVARLYPTAQVGQASSLLSNVSLLSYFSLFGFSTALVRFLPISRNQAEDAGTAISTVTVCSVVVNLGYVVVGPWLAHDLGFIQDTVTHVLLFVLLAGGAAVNLLTDSIFVAARATKANLLINGVLMSAAKLALPALAVSFGAFGIFAASGIASTLAAAVSIVVIRRHLRIRVRARISWDALRNMVSYSLSSYLSGTLNLIPQVALPIIVLHELGPVVAAVYFVAFQISNMVSSASYAIGESTFAEGAHESRSLKALAGRSAALMFAITGVAVLLVSALAQPILRLFGSDYADTGATTLILFTVSSLAVAFNTWASFLLRVTGQLQALVVANAAYLITVLGVALWMVPQGLNWAAIAWGVGNLVSGLVATIGLLSPPFGNVNWNE